MGKLEYLSKRANEYQERLNIVGSDLSKKWKIFDHFSGTEAVTIFTTCNDLNSVAELLYENITSVRVFGKKSAEDEKAIGSFENYLNHLYDEILHFESINASLQPAERPLTRELLTEITKRDKEISQCDEVIGARNLEIEEQKKTIAELNQKVADLERKLSERDETISIKQKTITGLKQNIIDLQKNYQEKS